MEIIQQPRFVHPLSFFILIFLFLFLLPGCNSINKQEKEQLIYDTVYLDGETGNSYTKIASSITYESIIKNDGKLPEAFTSGIKQKKIISLLMEALQTGKANAYDYHTNTPLTISQVDSIEKNTKEYQRDKIGRILFTEDWYYDSTSGKIIKDIESLILGYEVYKTNGDLKGYKPLIKIKMP